MALHETTRDFIFGLSDPAITDECLARIFRESATFFDEQLGLARDDAAEIRKTFQPASQADRIAEKEAERLAHVTEITSHRLRMLTDAKDRLEGELIAPQLQRQSPAGWDAADARAIEADARTMIRAMTPADRESAYLNAARQGDALTLRAFENVAPAFALVPDETIAQGRELFAEAANPEKYSALEQHRAAIRSIECDLNRVRRELAPSSVQAMAS